MFLRQRILVANIRIFHAVQRHVHRTDPQHGAVEIEAVEHLFVEMIAALLIVEQLRVVLAQVLASCDQETACAAGRIDNDVLRTWRHHLDHQRDDVAWRAELAVLSGGRDLRQHIFVEVALCVAVLHRDVGQQVDDLGEQGGRRDGEARALHVGGMRGAFFRHAAQEREDMLGND